MREGISGGADRLRRICSYSISRTSASSSVFPVPVGAGEFIIFGIFDATTEFVSFLKSFGNGRASLNPYHGTRRSYLPSCFKIAGNKRSRSISVSPFGLHCFSSVRFLSLFDLILQYRT